MTIQGSPRKRNVGLQRVTLNNRWKDTGKMQSYKDSKSQREEKEGKK